MQELKVTGMDSRMVLHIRPHTDYAEYLVLAVTHPAGDQVDTMLSRDSLLQLVAWLSASTGQHRTEDGLSHSWWRGHPSGVVLVTVGWGSSQAFNLTAALGREDVRLAQAWLAKVAREQQGAEA